MIPHCSLVAIISLLVSLFSLASAMGQNMLVSNDVNEIYAPLLEEGFVVKQFSVPVDDRWVHAVIAIPAAEDLTDEPVLLLTVGGPTMHLIPPNDLPARYFLERGHPVVSFDVGSMPGSLELYRDNVLKGPDPTLTFIKEAQAVIDGCVEAGWADPNRVAVTGISRYAYLALRLMAADERIRTAGAFAPVTDWRYLSEFDGHQKQQKVLDMQLANYVDGLTGKRLFMCIGGQDDRVGTEAAESFIANLKETNIKQGYDASLIDFYVTDDAGHTCGAQWYQRGMEIVFNAASSNNN